MGGRYGAADDGSSDYQDRRPDWGAREREQQTVAEAVRSVMQRQETNDRSRTQDTDDSTDQSGTGDTVRSAADRTYSYSSSIGQAVDQLITGVMETDEIVTDLVVEQLVEQIRRANEEELLDDEVMRER